MRPKPGGFVSAFCQITIMTSGRNEPRYLQLRTLIEGDIRNGTYPVGSLLPKEEILAQRYEVSRHTVREALRGLVQAGMIERFPSRGTVVKSDAPLVTGQKFIAGVANVHDVLQYTAKSRLAILMRSHSTLSHALAGELGMESAAGSEWICFAGSRLSVDDESPIGCSTLYVLPEYEHIGAALEQQGGSVFGLLNTLFGVEVRRVWQKIEAALMPDSAPFVFRDHYGKPALRLLRAYFDANGTMLTFSDNHFLSDRFQLIAQWEHDGSSVPPR